jgi:hypothetical protein
VGWYCVSSMEVIEFKAFFIVVVVLVAVVVVLLLLLLYQ